MKNYIRHVKYPELIEFYHSYLWPKCLYITFFTRVMRYKYDIDIAIKPHLPPVTNPNIYGDGRVCMKCKIHKPRSEFNKNNYSKTNHTTKCKACANIVHAEYRASGWYAKDRAYKKSRNTLHIWELIYFDDYYKHLATVWELEYWEVVDKPYRQWYKLKSTATGYYQSLDTNNTKKKFYRVNNLYPKQLSWKKLS